MTTTYTDHLLCLSIRQPFAERILLGEKRIEYRTWSTNHRGPLLIHASKSTAEDGHEGLPLGCIVGMVNLTACINAGDQYWWQLTEPVRFVEPIPFKGSAALFRVPLAIVQDSLVIPLPRSTYSSWSRSIPTA